MLSKPTGGPKQQPHPQQSQPHPQQSQAHPPVYSHSHTVAARQAHPNYSTPVQPQKPYQQQPHPQSVVQHQSVYHQGGTVFGSPVKPHKKATYSQMTGRPEIVSDHPLKARFNDQGQELRTNPPQVSVYIIYVV